MSINFKACTTSQISPYIHPHLNLPPCNPPKLTSAIKIRLMAMHADDEVEKNVVLVG